MSDEQLKRRYLQRFWLTMLVAALLATFPHYMWIVRFLSLVVFAVLAGWTEDAMLAWRSKAR